jgi:hypothetical protein
VSVSRQLTGLRVTAEVWTCRANDHDTGFYELQALLQPVAVAFSLQPFRTAYASGNTDFCFHIIESHYALPFKDRNENRCYCSTSFRRSSIDPLSPAAADSVPKSWHRITRREAVFSRPSSAISLHRSHSGFVPSGFPQAQCFDDLLMISPTGYANRCYSHRRCQLNFDSHTNWPAFTADVFCQLLRKRLSVFFLSCDPLDAVPVKRKSLAID